MLKYSDRDYYKQNVDEIKRCIEQSVGQDINWALKIVQSMQGEKGKGREMLLAAQKHLDLDDAREQRLIEVVTDLFEHAVPKRAPLRNKPVEPPDDGSRDFCGIKYYPHTFLVECPDSDELNKQVEKIIELIKIKIPTSRKYDYLRNQQAATAVRNALTSNWNTRTGKYDPPEFTIEQVVNMTPEDLLSIKFVGTKLAILVFERLKPMRNQPVDAFGVDKV